jgi:deglycase
VRTEAGERPGFRPLSWTDIRNAGGNWTDSEVVVCEAGPNALVTSRKPDDLPAFCASLVEVFGRQAQPA